MVCEACLANASATYDQSLARRRMEARARNGRDRTRHDLHPAPRSRTRSTPDRPVRNSRVTWARASRCSTGSTATSWSAPSRSRAPSSTLLSDALASNWRRYGAGRPSRAVCAAWSSEADDRARTGDPQVGNPRADAARRAWIRQIWLRPHRGRFVGSLRKRCAHRVSQSALQAGSVLRRGNRGSTGETKSTVEMRPRSDRQRDTQLVDLVPPARPAATIYATCLDML
jgi:hypothetical protein